jgi:hypothetical protein
VRRGGPGRIGWRGARLARRPRLGGRDHPLRARSVGLSRSGDALRRSILVRVHSPQPRGDLIEVELREKAIAAEPDGENADTAKRGAGREEKPDGPPSAPGWSSPGRFRRRVHPILRARVAAIRDGVVTDPRRDLQLGGSGPSHCGSGETGAGSGICAIAPISPACLSAATLDARYPDHPISPVVSSVSTTASVRSGLILRVVTLSIPF